MCEDMRAIGVTRDGGFAEYSVIPASQAFLLPPGTDYEVGAMAEPLACCVHGLDRSGIRAGETVLVIGGGTIGMIMLQLAKLAGAAKVYLSEPVKMRRDTALTLGADGVIDPLSGSASEQLADLSGAFGADTVIECAGNVKAAEQAVECAAKGASVMLFSVPKSDAKLSLPLFEVFQKELTIKGSFVNPDTHSRAVALLDKLQIAPLITHRFGLDKLEQAILTQMSAESVKVIVKPN
jgi:threonine dehydrogenase-like Zn-dependent dehydrogenase